MKGKLKEKQWLIVTDNLPKYITECISQHQLCVEIPWFFFINISYLADTQSYCSPAPVLAIGKSSELPILDSNEQLLSLVLNGSGWRRKHSQNETDLPLELSAIHSGLESHSCLIYTNAFMLYLLSAQGQSFQSKEWTQLTLAESEYVPSAPMAVSAYFILVEILQLYKHSHSVCLTLVF